MINEGATLNYDNSKNKDLTPLALLRPYEPGKKPITRETEKEKMNMKPIMDQENKQQDSTFSH